MITIFATLAAVVVTAVLTLRVVRVRVDRLVGTVESLAHTVATDLAEVRWRAAHQVDTHLAQVQHYREMCEWEADLAARETAAAAAMSFDQMFALITADLDVSDTPAHLLAAYDGPPSHYVSEAMPKELTAVVDEAWHAPVQYDALVDALLGGTESLPLVATHPDGPGSDDPTIPREVEPQTGRTRRWMPEAIRLPLTRTQPKPPDTPPSPRPSSPANALLPMHPLAGQMRAVVLKAMDPLDHLPIPADEMAGASS